MKRKYELKRRAERQEATRRRIVEAAVALHTTRGPARTSIAAVAEKAGVQRHTVYAHFPDDAALFTACSSHWQALNPFPDPSAWESLASPEDRLRTALDSVYGWYEQHEQPLTLFERDRALNPAHSAVMEEADEQRAMVADVLARGWPRRKAVRAAIGHALELETWRSLVRRHDLSQAQAADAMVQLVRSV